MADVPPRSAARHRARLALALAEAIEIAERISIACAIPIIPTEVSDRGTEEAEIGPRRRVGSHRDERLHVPRR